MQHRSLCLRSSQSHGEAIFTPPELNAEPHDSARPGADGGGSNHCASIVDFHADSLHESGAIAIGSSYHVDEKCAAHTPNPRRKRRALTGDDPMAKRVILGVLLFRSSGRAP